MLEILLKFFKKSFPYLFLFQYKQGYSQFFSFKFIKDRMYSKFTSNVLNTPLRKGLFNFTRTFYDHYEKDILGSRSSSKRSLFHHSLKTNYTFNRLGDFYAKPKWFKFSYFCNNNSSFLQSNINGIPNGFSFAYNMLESISEGNKVHLNSLLTTMSLENNQSSLSGKDDFVFYPLFTFQKFDNWFIILGFFYGMLEIFIVFFLASYFVASPLTLFHFLSNNFLLLSPFSFMAISSTFIGPAYFLFFFCFIIAFIFEIIFYLFDGGESLSDEEYAEDSFVETPPTSSFFFNFLYTAFYILPLVFIWVFFVSKILSFTYLFIEFFIIPFGFIPIFFITKFFSSLRSNFFISFNNPSKSHRKNIMFDETFFWNPSGKFTNNFLKSDFVKRSRKTFSGFTVDSQSRKFPLHLSKTNLFFWNRSQNFKRNRKILLHKAASFGFLPEERLKFVFPRFKSFNLPNPLLQRIWLYTHLFTRANTLESFFKRLHSKEISYFKRKRRKRGYTNLIRKRRAPNFSGKNNHFDSIYNQLLVAKRRLLPFFGFPIRAKNSLKPSSPLFLSMFLEPYRSNNTNIRSVLNSRFRISSYRSKFNKFKFIKLLTDLQSNSRGKMVNLQKRKSVFLPLSSKSIFVNRSLNLYKNYTVKPLFRHPYGKSIFDLTEARRFFFHLRDSPVTNRTLFKYITSLFIHKKYRNLYKGPFQVKFRPRYWKVKRKYRKRSQLVLSRHNRSYWHDRGLNKKRFSFRIGKLKMPYHVRQSFDSPTRFFSQLILQNTYRNNPFTPQYNHGLFSSFNNFDRNFVFPLLLLKQDPLIVSRILLSDSFSFSDYIHRIDTQFGASSPHFRNRLDLNLKLLLGSKLYRKYRQRLHYVNRYATVPPLFLNVNPFLASKNFKLFKKSSLMLSKPDFENIDKIHLSFLKHFTTYLFRNHFKMGRHWNDSSNFVDIKDALGKIVSPSKKNRFFTQLFFHSHFTISLRKNHRYMIKNAALLRETFINSLLFKNNLNLVVSDGQKIRYYIRKLIKINNRMKRKRRHRSRNKLFLRSRVKRLSRQELKNIRKNKIMKKSSTEYNKKSRRFFHLFRRFFFRRFLRKRSRSLKHSFLLKHSFYGAYQHFLAHILKLKGGASFNSSYVNFNKLLLVPFFNLYNTTTGISKISPFWFKYRSLRRFEEAFVRIWHDRKLQANFLYNLNFFNKKTLFFQPDSTPFFPSQFNSLRQNMNLNNIVRKRRYQSSQYLFRSKNSSILLPFFFNKPNYREFFLSVASNRPFPSNKLHLAGYNRLLSLVPRNRKLMKSLYDGFLNWKKWRLVSKGKVRKKLLHTIRSRFVSDFLGGKDNLDIKLRSLSNILGIYSNINTKFSRFYSKIKKERRMGVPFSYDKFLLNTRLFSSRGMSHVFFKNKYIPNKRFVRLKNSFVSFNYPSTIFPYNELVAKRIFFKSFSRLATQMTFFSILKAPQCFLEQRYNSLLNLLVRKYISFLLHSRESFILKSLNNPLSQKHFPSFFFLLKPFVMQKGRDNNFIFKRSKSLFKMNLSFPRFTFFLLRMEHNDKLLVEILKRRRAAKSVLNKNLFLSFFPNILVSNLLKRKKDFYKPFMAKEKFFRNTYRSLSNSDILNNNSFYKKQRKLLRQDYGSSSLLYSKQPLLSLFLPLYSTTPRTFGFSKSFSSSVYAFLPYRTKLKFSLFNSQNYHLSESKFFPTINSSFRSSFSSEANDVLTERRQRRRFQYLRHFLYKYCNVKYNLRSSDLLLFRYLLSKSRKFSKYDYLFNQILEFPLIYSKKPRPIDDFFFDWSYPFFTFLSSERKKHVVSFKRNFLLSYPKLKLSNKLLFNNLNGSLDIENNVFPFSVKPQYAVEVLPRYSSALFRDKVFKIAKSNPFLFKKNSLKHNFIFLKNFFLSSRETGGVDHISQKLTDPYFLYHYLAKYNLFGKIYDKRNLSLYKSSRVSPFNGLSHEEFFSFSNIYKKMYSRPRYFKALSQPGSAFVQPRKFSSLFYLLRPNIMNEYFNIFDRSGFSKGKAYFNINRRQLPLFHNFLSNPSIQFWKLLHTKFKPSLNFNSLLWMKRKYGATFLNTFKKNQFIWSKTLKGERKSHLKSIFQAYNYPSFRNYGNRFAFSIKNRLDNQDKLISNNVFLSPKAAFAFGKIKIPQSKLRSDFSLQRQSILRQLRRSVFAFKASTGFLYLNYKLRGWADRLISHTVPNDSIKSIDCELDEAIIAETNSLFFKSYIEYSFHSFSSLINSLSLFVDKGVSLTSDLQFDLIIRIHSFFTNHFLKTGASFVDPSVYMRYDSSPFLFFDKFFNISSAFSENVVVPRTNVDSLLWTVNDMLLAEQVRLVSYNEILKYISQYNLIVLDRKYQKFLDLHSILHSNKETMINDYSAFSVSFDLEPFFSSFYETAVFRGLNFNNFNLLEHLYNLHISGNGLSLSTILSVFNTFNRFFSFPDKIVASPFNSFISNLLSSDFQLIIYFINFFSNILFFFKYTFLNVEIFDFLKFFVNFEWIYSSNFFLFCFNFGFAYLFGILYFILSLFYYFWLYKIQKFNNFPFFDVFNFVFKKNPVFWDWNLLTRKQYAFRNTPLYNKNKIYSNFSNTEEAWSHLSFNDFYDYDFDDMKGIFSSRLKSNLFYGNFFGLQSGAFTVKPDSSKFMLFQGKLLSYRLKFFHSLYSINPATKLNFNNLLLGEVLNNTLSENSLKHFLHNTNFINRSNFEDNQNVSVVHLASNLSEPKLSSISNLRYKKDVPIVFERIFGEWFSNFKRAAFYNFLSSVRNWIYTKRIRRRFIKRNKFKAPLSFLKKRKNVLVSLLRKKQSVFFIYKASSLTHSTFLSSRWRKIKRISFLRQINGISIMNLLTNRINQQSKLASPSITLRDFFYLSRYRSYLFNSKVTNSLFTETYMSMFSRLHLTDKTFFPTGKNAYLTGTFNSSIDSFSDTFPEAKFYSSGTWFIIFFSALGFYIRFLFIIFISFIFFLIFFKYFFLYFFSLKIWLLS